MKRTRVDRRQSTTGEVRYLTIPLRRGVRSMSRHPVRTLHRHWPAVAILAGVLAIGLGVAATSLLSQRRSHDVAALSQAVKTQNTRLSDAGLPTLGDPSAIISGTSDLPSITTTTATVSAAVPTTEYLPGLPIPGPIRTALVTITAGGQTYTSTVTGSPGAPVTVTGPAGVPVTMTMPARTVTETATVSTTTTAAAITETTTAPAPPGQTVTVTEPAPAPAPVTVTVTATEPAPPVQTVTATETTTEPGPTVTETITAPAPPAPESSEAS